MKEIATWDRPFQVWQYTVSHAVLLLRSFRPPEHRGRVDVAFHGVSLMKVRPRIARLVIKRVDREEAARILGDQLPSHGDLFLFNDGDDYVCAGSCSWHEDQGHSTSPSHFGPLRGTE